MKMAIRNFILTTLFLTGITAGMGSQAAPVISSVQTIYRGGEHGVNWYRIPILTRANNGDLLAFTDTRHQTMHDLPGGKPIDVAIRRSSDQGKTWSEMKLLHDFKGSLSAGDASVIVDRTTGSIFCFCNVFDNQDRSEGFHYYMQESQDNGKTWTEPKDLTHALRNPKWDARERYTFITSGSGIQLKDGTLLHTMTYAGKKIFLFGSTDHGKTWGPIGTSVSPGDECKVIELKDGSWLVNTRLNGSGYRWSYRTEDRGKTWSKRKDSQLPDPGCNAAIVRFNDQLLFANDRCQKDRKELILRMSSDEGQTWSEGWIIDPGMAGYVDMAVLDRNKIALLYEADNYRSIKFVTVTF